MSARFQRISKTSASTQPSKRTLPFSCERIAASSSRSSAIPAIASAIAAARSCALSADHAGKAAFAAATASATSSFEADAACPTITPGLAGSAIARVSAASRASPPMNSPVRTGASVTVFDNSTTSLCLRVACRAVSLRDLARSSQACIAAIAEGKIADKIRVIFVCDLGSKASL